MLSVEDLRVTLLSVVTEPQETLTEGFKILSDGIKELMKISFEGWKDDTVGGVLA